MSQHPDPGHFRNFARIGLCALVFTIFTWQWFQWKGIVSFVPFWAVYELFYRSRVRGMLACPHCGFDPYLYLVDTQLARQEIESHWKRKFAEHGIPFPAPKHGTPLPETHLPASGGGLTSGSTTEIQQSPEDSAP